MIKKTEWYKDLADVSTISQILNIMIQIGDGITRAEIARITGFSKSTISQHIEKLKKGGFIVDANDEMNTQNKKSLYLKFNKNHSYVICIDFGVTSLNVAICNLAGEPIIADFQDGININAGPHVMLPNVVAIATQLMKQAGIDLSQILGVGMGVPSPVEFSIGRPIAPPIMRGGWDGFPVKDYLEDAFGKRAFVDNDVNLLIMAEHEKGIAHRCENFIVVKLGTGIGCGIYSGGRIYRGSTGCAGDIGHTKINGSDVLCTCGNRGCLERIAGGTAIARQALTFAQNGTSHFLAEALANGETIDCKTVNAALLAQDPVCIEYVQNIGSYIGEALARVVNFYNPSMVVLGGGLSNLGDLLFNSVRDVVYRASSTLATRDLVIKYSNLGDSAGVIGAATMVRDEMFSPRQFTRTMGTVASD